MADEQTSPQRVDARARGEANALTVVCGIPLLVRVLRGLSRTDVASAVVFTRDREHAAQISRALADYPVKDSLSVAIEVAEDDVDLGPTCLRGWAVYGRNDFVAADFATLGEPEPQIVVETRSDAKKARRILFNSIRKTISLDGIIAYYAHRPLSRLITRVLVDTKISANGATLMSMAVGLLAAFFATRGDQLGFILAGAGYFASGIFDCVDGDLARIRLEMSRVGEWLDSMTDELNTLSLLVGVGIGISRGGGDSLWLAICVGGALIGGLALARQYLELHRRGVTVNTAEFPWFFRNQEDTTTTKADSPLGWVLIGIGYLIRRDANITGISILLIVGLPKVAAGITAGALVAVAALTVVHFAVTRTQRAT